MVPWLSWVSKLIQQNTGQYNNKVLFWKQRRLEQCFPQKEFATGCRPGGFRQFIVICFIVYSCFFMEKKMLGYIECSITLLAKEVSASQWWFDQLYLILAARKATGCCTQFQIYWGKYCWIASCSSHFSCSGSLVNPKPFVKFVKIKSIYIYNYI